MVKLGIFTSEFYVALFGIGTAIVTQVQARCNFDMPFLITIGGIVVSYVLGRTWLKGQAMTPPTPPVSVTNITSNKSV
jgi:biotin transporter BioY